MWKVYLRDALGQRQGEVDDYTSLDAVVRFNEVGTWSLVVDGRASLAAQLITPGYGIELVRDDTTTVITGPMRHVKIHQDGDDREYTVDGVDDIVWLKRRLAHPQPATAAPPYSTNEFDVRTGVCSTVLRAYVNANAGTGALLPRRVPSLSLDTDPVIGATVTGRARWQVLLTLLQELAVSGGNLGFRVAKSGSSLLFQVYQPVDRTATVKLSTELGNLFGYDADIEASEVDYVYCGGGGEGTARTIREGQDGDEAITWGRAESFVDRRDTTDNTELDQEITKALTEGVGKTGLTVNPVDDANGMQFLADYQLGDRVTYVLDGMSYSEVVREAHIQLTPDGPQRTTPVLQTPGRTDILTVFRRLRDVEARLRDLERR